MKIFLTGANGFTGRHFVKRAQLHGHEVISFVGDLSDRDALRRQLLSALPDFVVHFAAISFVGHVDISAFYNVNVIGTINLLDALLELPVLPKKILIASSANIYGNNPNSPIGEHELPNPLNHYAVSKLAMEHMVTTYFNKLPIFITRPFNYIGIGQDTKFVIPKIVNHFIRREKTIELGNLNVDREFNDVETVCDIYLHLLRFADNGEIYNICSGKTYSLSHVIECMKEISGFDIKVNVNPAFVRSNELQTLCGDFTKVINVFAINNVKIDFVSLKDTLLKMYLGIL